MIREADIDGDGQVAPPSRHPPPLPSFLSPFSPQLPPPLPSPLPPGELRGVRHHDDQQVASPRQGQRATGARDFASLKM